MVGQDGHGRGRHPERTAGRHGRAPRVRAAATRGGGRRPAAARRSTLKDVEAGQVQTLRHDLPWPEVVSAATVPPAAARGSWIPWLFVAFFAVVVAVNGAMIWLALSSWTGLAANQPYDQGPAIQPQPGGGAAPGGARLAAPARRAAGARRRRARSSCVLLDAAGRPVTDAQVVVGVRAADQRGPRIFAVVMPEASPGDYRASFELPLIGAWNLHATIRRGDDLFVHEQRVMLR